MGGEGTHAPEAMTAGPASFFDILYAEDFDRPSNDQRHADATGGVAEPPPITQADLDDACATAVREARLQWAYEEERDRASTLATIGGVLAEIRETCEGATLAAADGTVSTILSIVTGLMPEFSRQHGPAEVRALLGRLLPTLQSQTKISVRVHPDLVSALERDFSELEPDLVAMIAVTAGPLDRADVKVAWENGSLTRDSQQILQAVQDALSVLGLHRKVEAPTKRTMAYAD